MMYTKWILVLSLWLNPTTAFMGNTNRPTTQTPLPSASSTTLNVKSNAGASVQTLLTKKRATVDALATISPTTDELTRLRFALAFPTQSQATRALRENLAFPTQS